MAKKEEVRKAEAVKAKEKAQAGGEPEKKLQVLDQVEEGTIDELISGECGSCIDIPLCSNCSFGLYTLCTYILSSL